MRDQHDIFSQWYKFIGKHENDEICINQKLFMLDFLSSVENMVAQLSIPITQFYMPHWYSTKTDRTETIYCFVITKNAPVLEEHLYMRFEFITSNLINEISTTCLLVEKVRNTVIKGELFDKPLIDTDQRDKIYESVKRFGIE